MKSLKSKADIELASEAFELNEQAKIINKRLSEIKNHFKAKLGTDTAKAGSILISISVTTPEGVDRALLKQELGAKAEKFLTHNERKAISFKAV